jgi:micrococcal nuclease
MYEYKCKVLRVIDGDTIDVLADLGFKVYKKIRVRFHGIDAPETRTRNKAEKKRGFAAKARLIELLDQSDNEVIIKSICIGKFGRAICEVYANPGMVTRLNINRTLVLEGHAENL